jgi:tetratricopeptide (TPR) repeat protein
VGLVLGILFTVGIDRRLRPIEALLPQEEELRTTRGPAESQGSQQTLARLIQQGLHYERAGQTPQAMAAYQAALDQVTIPLNRLARLFEKQGEAAQGIPLARLAVQLRPDVAEYLDTLAALLCLVGEREEARSWLEKAAVLQPQKFLPKLEAFRGGACQ